MIPKARPLALQIVPSVSCAARKNARQEAGIPISISILVMVHGFHGCGGNGSRHCIDRAVLGDLFACEYFEKAALSAANEDSVCGAKENLQMILRGNTDGLIDVHWSKRCLIIHGVSLLGLIASASALPIPTERICS